MTTNSNPFRKWVNIDPTDTEIRITLPDGRRLDLELDLDALVDLADSLSEGLALGTLERGAPLPESLPVGVTLRGAGEQ